MAYYTRKYVPYNGTEKDFLEHCKQYSSFNLWEKNGHRRLYVNGEIKFSFSTNQSKRFVKSNFLYYDLNEFTIVTEAKEFVDGFCGFILEYNFMLDGDSCEKKKEPEQTELEKEFEKKQAEYLETGSIEAFKESVILYMNMKMKKEVTV